ncbi:GNAT family N-acetyltransferase [Kitasatospora sp. NPDC088391]|uniref:GNAT family N-acetyltransferase n=1 Tax=Kitasatospora sp. NPDC088391 TaxID=3364074 RepID=UPI003823EF7E
MIFRPIVPQEIGSVLAHVRPDSSTTLSADLIRSRLALGEYRPGWIWIAEPVPGRAPMAIAVWWGRPLDCHPGSLDALFAPLGPLPVPAGPPRRTAWAASCSTDPRSAVAAALLTAAHQVFAADGLAIAPPFHLFLPPAWRARSDVAAAVAWRRRAAEAAGLHCANERLRFEWTTDRPVPALSGRLRFVPEPDDEVFVRLIRRVLPGTLERSGARECMLVGAEAQARSEVAFYRQEMLGKRAWWRIARTTTGHVVGFGIPSHNSEVPVTGPLGVLPEFRGRGFAAEILAETTRILAAETGAAVIRGETDIANHPMVAAFELVGYLDHARRLVLSAG